MDTVLVFTTSSGRASAEMLAGIHAFAKGARWNVQSFEFEGEPFPIRELASFWSPVGCIVEGNGTGLPAKKVVGRGFGRLPVVYLGCDSDFLPVGATSVIHDAKAFARLVSRELLTRDFRQFAFVGIKGRSWSQRRKSAFADALRLNGHALASYDMTKSPAITGKTSAAPLKSFLSSLEKPCGLLAADDAVAQTVLSICRLAGIAVPDDLAVIGVDDNESICEHTEPTLTSVHPDFLQAGRFAARLLAKKILRAKRIPEKTLFATSGLTRRGSTRAFIRRDPAVAAAIERIHASGGATLTPQDVLAAFPCSRRNAEKRFRLATGRSVLDELMDVRLDLAKDLLANTEISVSLIAERCGYRYPARLINAFREATGSTPLAWRKQHALTRGR